MHRIFCRFYGLIWHKVGTGRANNSQKTCRIKSENFLLTENKVYFFDENLGLSRCIKKATIQEYRYDLIAQFQRRVSNARYDDLA